MNPGVEIVPRVKDEVLNYSHGGYFGFAKGLERFVQYVTYHQDIFATAIPYNSHNEIDCFAAENHPTMAALGHVVEHIFDNPSHCFRDDILSLCFGDNASCSNIQANQPGLCPRGIEWDCYLQLSSDMSPAETLAHLAVTHGSVSTIVAESLGYQMFSSVQTTAFSGIEWLRQYALVVLSLLDPVKTVDNVEIQSLLQSLHNNIHKNTSNNDASTDITTTSIQDNSTDINDVRVNLIKVDDRDFVSHFFRKWHMLYALENNHCFHLVLDIKSRKATAADVLQIIQSLNTFGVAVSIAGSFVHAQVKDLERYAQTINTTIVKYLTPYHFFHTVGDVLGLTEQARGWNCLFNGGSLLEKHSSGNNKENFTVKTALFRSLISQCQSLNIELGIYVAEQNIHPSALKVLIQLVNECPEWLKLGICFGNVNGVVYVNNQKNAPVSSGLNLQYWIGKGDSGRYLGLF